MTAAIGTRFNEVAATLSFVTAGVSARITPNLDARASTAWDAQLGRSVETRVGFDLRFQCWAIMAEYVNRDGKEDEVRVSIGLLGIGQTGTRFGSPFGPTGTSSGSPPR